MLLEDAVEVFAAVEAAVVGYGLAAPVGVRQQHALGFVDAYTYQEIIKNLQQTIKYYRQLSEQRRKKNAAAREKGKDEDKPTPTTEPTPEPEPEPAPTPSQVVAATRTTASATKDKDRTIR